MRADQLPEDHSHLPHEYSKTQAGSQRATLNWADNRPAAVAQRQQQASLNHSPYVQRQATLQQSIQNTLSFATRLHSPTALVQQPAVQRQPNNTRLPDHLKAGVESLSGYSLDDVRGHYNSAQPAQLQAHAYAQGTDIHVPGLVVQQKQGRVRPTMQLKGQVAVNDDAELEKEADVMGARAISNTTAQAKSIASSSISSQHHVIQNKLYNTKAEKEPLNAEEIQALINRLTGKYGESQRGAITTLVNKYVHDGGRRSVRDAEDLVRVNVKIDASRPTPLDFDEADGPMLPSGRTAMPSSSLGLQEPSTTDRRAAIRTMEFNSVTFLTAKVFLSDGFSFTVELRNQEGKDNQGHAEMLLLKQIKDQIKNKHEVRIAQITITINNSPCKLCGPDLADWASNNGNPRIVIHFTNAYGKEEEFIHSVEAMKNAGIELHDFNPMDHVGSDTDDEFETTKRSGESIKERFNRQALKGRQSLAAVAGDAPLTRQQGASSASAAVRPMPDYATWMVQITSMANAEYGLSLEDLPDQPYRVSYEDGMSAEEFYREFMKDGKAY